MANRWWAVLNEKQSENWKLRGLKLRGLSQNQTITRNFIYENAKRNKSYKVIILKRMFKLNPKRAKMMRCSSKSLEFNHWTQWSMSKVSRSRKMSNRYISKCSTPRFQRFCAKTILLPGLTSSSKRILNLAELENTNYSHFLNRQISQMNYVELA